MSSATTHNVCLHDLVRMCVGRRCVVSSQDIDLNSPPLALCTLSVALLKIYLRPLLLSVLDNSLRLESETPPPCHGPSTCHCKNFHRMHLLVLPK